MSQNLMTASNQYAQRPDDERFATLDDLIAARQHERDNSIEAAYNLRDLTVLAGDRDILLQSPKGIQASFSHWSFGQFCRTLGAPAGYLRDGLTPTLAAQCLAHGIDTAPTGTRVNLLVRGQNDAPPLVRACTSDKYGRVWDADLYGAIAGILTKSDTRWSLPPVWPGAKPGGAYAGDRDSFVIVTNGGSIVTDPTAQARRDGTNAGPDDGAMYRGLMIRNSEVGACSVTIEQILFRFICGNHILWGAVVDKVYRRRHVGTEVNAATLREIGSIAHRWTNASESRDRAIIDQLIRLEVAHTKEGVLDELRAMGATKDQAQAAWDAAEVYEAGASPRSFWGLAQGFTRASQATEYQDDRYALDRFAASLLQKGARVAA